MKQPKLFILTISLVFCVHVLWAEEELDFKKNIGTSSSLLKQLELVEEINQRLQDTLPLFYNFSMIGGYYSMPSARMAPSGTVAFGAAIPPPYNIYGLNIQVLDRIEVSANYLIYTGVEEPGFGSQGFGDDAERIGNIKVGILTPSEDLPFFPLISYGANDFIGTKRFNSQYIVATKAWVEYDFEFTLGWGNGRIDGFFGGAAWSPFHKKDHFFKNLTILAEYDANDYENSPGEHPGARSVKSRFNAGVNLLAFDCLQLSVSSVRGEKVGYAAS